MNHKLLSVALVLACGFGVLLLHGSLPADETSHGAPNSDVKFSNGILLLDIVKGSGLAGHESQMITDAKLVKIGNRFFVRGKGFVAKEFVDDPKWNWYRGADVAYAWDTVVGFFDFTPAQLEKYLSSSKKD
jgi:hypothetical protein